MRDAIEAKRYGLTDAAIGKMLFIIAESIETPEIGVSFKECGVEQAGHFLNQLLHHLPLRNYHTISLDSVLYHADSPRRYVKRFEEAIARFEVGDEVRLVSGGPAMTVIGVSDELVYCRWFSAEETLREDKFHPMTVKKSGAK